MLTLKTERQCKLIVSNIVSVIKSGNIDKLSKQAYTFLYLCSGFIAHYNFYGFKDYYQNTNDLAYDIQCNRINNQWSNFRIGEKDAEYFHQKRDIYNAILEEI